MRQQTHMLMRGHPPVTPTQGQWEIPMEGLQVTPMQGLPVRTPMQGLAIRTLSRHTHRLTPTGSLCHIVRHRPATGTHQPAPTGTRRQVTLVSHRHQVTLVIQRTATTSSRHQVMALRRHMGTHQLILGTRRLNMLDIRRTLAIRRLHTAMGIRLLLAMGTHRPRTGCLWVTRRIRLSRPGMEATREAALEAVVAVVTGASTLAHSTLASRTKKGFE